MADLPFGTTTAVRRALLPYVDPEGKIPRAVADLAAVAGRDVVIVDADGDLRAGQLAGLGARVVAVGAPAIMAGLGRAGSGARTVGSVTTSAGTAADTGLDEASADVVVGFWSAFRPGDDAAFVEAERILRPGGRLLAVHDYARDDLAALYPPERSRDLVAWSRRDGWFATHGFRIRVIHAFWTFPDERLLRAGVAAAFGGGSGALLGDRHRPRLSWKVVVYHRTRAT